MVNAVFNPGATIIDGRTLLLVRVEDRTGLSSLVVATSEDGLNGWEVDPVRGLQPQRDRFEELWGIEDPRITRVGDEYFVVYVGYSAAGPLVCLARTRDFVQWERSGILQPPEDKDAALFPTTFGGRWALVHRPVTAMSGVGPTSGCRSAPTCNTGATPGCCSRHGMVVGGTPIKSGSALLPCSPRMVGCCATTACASPCPGRSTGSGWHCWTGTTRPRSWRAWNEWVFGPSAPYERSGDVPGVVFPCGWILRDDGDTLHLYYGAADNVVCVAEASLARLLSHLGEHPCRPA